MVHPTDHPRRRLWPVFVPTGIVLVIAIGWSAGWYYAASKAEDTIAEWRAREARGGRVHSCGSQSIGGFPFRIEVRCRDAGIALRDTRPPLMLKAPAAVAAAQIYDPTLIISEFSGPMTIAESGRPVSYVANWKLLQASVRGTPRAPERASVVIDDATVDHVAVDGRTNWGSAKRVAVHGRIVSGTVRANPVIDVAFDLRGATAPEIHSLAAEPFDAALEAELRGLKDFAPKSWPQRFREIQERGGSIDVRKMRVHQGSMIMVGGGTFGIGPNGHLDGEMKVTIAGLEKFLRELGIDQPQAQNRVLDRYAPAFNALDRVLPGLGNVARQHAGAGIVAGLGLIGERTTLEGQQAVAVPLRFQNGVVMLGPLRIGRTAPLF